MGAYKEFDTVDLGRAFEKAASKPPIVEIDVERYQALLDDPDLTPEQQRQCLEALWSIITAFVELGFNVHPMSHACGQLPETFALSAKDEEDAVE